VSVGEIGDVGEKLWDMSGERVHEGCHGVEIKMADGEVGRGGVRCGARKTFIDGDIEESRADESSRQGHVLGAVVVDVEVGSFLIGIHHRNFDHDASPAVECACVREIRYARERGVK